MKILRFLILFIFFQGLTGCTLLQSFTPSSPEHIQSLIEREDYTRALQAIETVPRNHKNYTQLIQKKKTIKQLIQTLEQSTLRKAQKLVAQNQWYKAEQLYEEALKKIPDSAVVKKNQRAFIASRNYYLKDLESELTLYEGQWIKNVEQILNNIARTTPNNAWVTIRQWRFEQKKSSILEDLVSCTQNATSTANYPLARRCLSLVKEIDHDKKFKQTLSAAHKKLDQNEQHLRELRIQQSMDLIKQLEQSYDHKKLAQLNQQILLFETSQSLNREELEVKQTLQQHLDLGIKQGIEDGRKIYSEGQVTEALAIWEGLYEINPDNKDLETLILRAQRVLDKLRDLNKDETIVQPPQN
ncbi:MAG: hypothetical protein OQK73_01890 [Gammaproteobacteria bacterium]|nr:hypothetical protein [Gammaproteobacteria bacterium]